MLFHTHLMFGVAAFLLMSPVFSGGNEILFLVLVLLGSILPDIDDVHSKIKKASGVIGSIISFMFKHRGIFHSLVMVIILFVLVSFWSSYYAIGLSIGYLSHLLSDSLTPMGIRIFYPFSSWKLRGPIKVGSAGEWIVLFGLVVLVAKEMLF
jgi:inner membrane protein